MFLLRDAAPGDADATRSDAARGESQRQRNVKATVIDLHVPFVLGDEVLPAGAPCEAPR